MILAGALLAALAAGCGGGVAKRPSTSCADLDEILAARGLRSGVAMSGRTTIDVNQYRVRGIFALTVSAAGDLVFEFTSTGAMGGRHEDVVFSFYGDTLRVLDRERGRFYVGAEVDELVRDGLGFAVETAEIVRRVVAGPLVCGRVSEGRAGADRVRGRVDGGDFTVVFSGGRAASGDWPAPFPGAARSDRIRVNYEWRGESLGRLTILMPQRRWRIRLEADPAGTP